MAGARRDGRATRCSTAALRTAGHIPHDILSQSDTEGSSCLIRGQATPEPDDVSSGERPLGANHADVVAGHGGFPPKARADDFTGRSSQLIGMTTELRFLHSCPREKPRSPGRTSSRPAEPGGLHGDHSRCPSAPRTQTGRRRPAMHLDVLPSTPVSGHPRSTSATARSWLLGSGTRRGGGCRGPRSEGVAPGKVGRARRHLQVRLRPIRNDLLTCRESDR
jgi:hypothetical protein